MTLPPPPPPGLFNKCPLPPPLTNGNILPPPPKMGVTGVPPPPMLGKGPPGILPNPSGPKKSAIKPMKEMKSLFWQRIQVHDNTYKEWLKVLTENKTEPPLKSTIWDILTEELTATFKLPFDENNFVEFFSQTSSTNPSATGKSFNPRGSIRGGGSNRSSETSLTNFDTDLAKISTVLEARRSLDLGVMLKSFRLEASQIESAILGVNYKVLDIDKVKKIYDSRPTSDEVKAIKTSISALEGFKGDVLDLLEIPEKYCLLLSRIPNLEERLWCMMFPYHFSETYDCLHKSLNQLSLAIDAILNNKTIHRFVMLLLQAGNYMNGGNKVRGQADGFYLDILTTLRGVKGKNNVVNLLQYIVGIQMNESIHATLKAITADLVPEGQVSSFSVQDNVPYPLPDPSFLREVCWTNFDDLQENVKLLDISLQTFKEKITKVSVESSIEYLNPFKEIMTEMLHQAELKFAQQVEDLKRSKIEFRKLVTFYCWKPGKLDDLNKPSEFFKIWQTFCQDYKDMWTIEQQKRLKKMKIQGTAQQNPVIRRLSIKLKEK